MPGAVEPVAPQAADLAATALSFARRFARGATLWCAAPSWPHHARHVAVEFVHPVIVGKRALPAVALSGHDVVGELRRVSRPGDILLAIGASADPALREAARLAQVWGLLTAWTGTGERPGAGAADHVLWLEGDALEAAFSGGYVLLYHLLWELTHVCFEHPGVLEGTAADGASETCVTCSDEGRLAEVVAVQQGARARVRSSAGIEAVDTTLIDSPRPGDVVLVHAGSVLSLVEPAR